MKGDIAQCAGFSALPCCSKMSMLDLFTAGVLNLASCISSRIRVNNVEGYCLSCPCEHIGHCLKGLDCTVRLKEDVRARYHQHRDGLR